MESLPNFNLTLGASTLLSKPPFNFGHVIMRVFPLRAEMRQLRRFCDKYLNISPFARFEPALPYAYLQIINYGRLEPEAQELGWVSQNEVLFNVPLNWYERKSKDDPWVFRDVATAAPFIFVDEEASIRMGREVYGWAKSLAELTPDVNEWAKHPRSRQVLFTLSAMVFPELFAGRRRELHPLFEIEKEPTPTIAKLPLDPFNPLNPLLSWPKAVLEGTRLATGLLEFAVGLPLRGYPEKRRVREPITGTLSKLNLLSRLPVANTVNLKQFRDCEHPEKICYQALTSGEMRVEAVHEGGLLGDLFQLQGDPTGGHRIRVHRFDAWPIIESLGLEVADESVEGDHEVATLEPIFPFWVDLDILYGKSEAICSRTKRSTWVLGEGGQGPSSDTKKSVRKPGAERKEAPRYNTAEGGSFEQVSGPFHFPNVTYRVLPLLADPNKLQKFLDGYLNHRPKEDPDFGQVGQLGEPPTVKRGNGLPDTYFQAWGSYVYLAALSFEEMSSDSQNVGWWTERHVAFYVPVRWWKYSKKSESWELASVAVVMPYAFEDSEVAATTGREIQGWPAVKAEIGSPPSNWMEKEGPALRPRLLTVSSKVYSTANVGIEMKERLVLEIFGHDILPYYDAEKWGTVAHEWGDRLTSELRRKQGMDTDDESAEFLKGFVEGLKTLSLEVLANREPMNIIALKQFPAASNLDKACYQAITQTTERIDWLRDLRAIDTRLHVALHRYATFPIVETLGLYPKWTDRSQETVVDYLQPIRPFWCRLDLKEDLGRELYWRAGDGRWKQAPNQTQYFESDEPTGVGYKLVEDIVAEESGSGPRQGLKELTRRFRERVQERVILEKEQAALSESVAGLEKQEETALADFRKVFEKEKVQAAIKSIPPSESGPIGLGADGWAFDRNKLLNPEWDALWRPIPEGIYDKVRNFRKAHGQLELQRESLKQKEDRLKVLEPYEPFDRRFWGAMVALLTEPQQAIEGILSQQWAHQGKPGKRKPAFLIRQDTIGHEPTRRVFEQKEKLESVDEAGEYWHLAASDESSADPA